MKECENERRELEERYRERGERRGEGEGEKARVIARETEP